MYKKLLMMISLSMSSLLMVSVSHATPIFVNDEGSITFTRLRFSGETPKLIRVQRQDGTSSIIYNSVDPYGSVVVPYKKTLTGFNAGEKLELIFETILNPGKHTSKFPVADKAKITFNESTHVSTLRFADYDFGFSISNTTGVGPITSPVPETSTYAMLSLGLLMIALYNWNVRARVRRKMSAPVSLMA